MWISKKDESESFVWLGCCGDKYFCCHSDVFFFFSPSETPWIFKIADFESIYATFSRQSLFFSLSERLLTFLAGFKIWHFVRKTRSVERTGIEMLMRSELLSLNARNWKPQSNVHPPPMHTWEEAHESLSRSFCMRNLPAAACQTLADLLIAETNTETRTACRSSS